MSLDEPGAFEAVFHENVARVFAYAGRHVGLSDADDVVADTFAIAWRRRDAMPDPALPWLLVTARNVIRNQRRSKNRTQLNWANAVRELWHETTPSPDVIVEERDAAITALQSCTEQEREALLLVAWDGLSTSEAAAVAGCSAQAFKVRLSRARSRLQASLGPESDPSSPPRRTLRLANPRKEES